MQDMDQGSCSPPTGSSSVRQHGPAVHRAGSATRLEMWVTPYSQAQQLAATASAARYTWLYTVAVGSSHSHIQPRKNAMGWCITCRAAQAAALCHLSSSGHMNLN
eukprot:jgi/Ulvmu1/5610/UM023_0148.1